MDNLIQYRLDNAQEKLESAEILLNPGKYKDSIGRSYYAVFSAVYQIFCDRCAVVRRRICFPSINPTRDCG